ncbi:8977_t:CDS:2 [Funneliformis mosseae]|uniref:DNA topoisomerase (ATP-hydrolyzing) n=1 Tax=Funneliformis mosseae TaxID=27381 RepID=A0A9N9FDH1_FUNMO|nr:8977_t:CDS:2 [Funneliformis mosseae]
MNKSIVIDFVREIPRMDIISRWFQDAFIVVIGHGLVVYLWQKRMCEFILNSRKRPNGQQTRMIYNDQTGGSQKRVHDPMTLCPWDGAGELSGLANDQTGGSQKRVHDPMTLCPWDGGRKRQVRDDIKVDIDEEGPSNYDDEEKKVSGGRNGFGAKLANIYNSEFILETVSNGKNFQEQYDRNRQLILITCSENACDYTWVIFRSDLQKFKMTRFDDDIFSLLAYDLAGCVKEVQSS